MRPFLLRSTAVRLAAALLLSVSTAACGGGGGGAGDPGGQPQNAADLYVDAQNGSDANDGSPGAPFKSLTFAMTQASSGMVVKVEPGFYDAGNGESFPIVVKGGIQLIGDIDNKGKGATPTMIIGGGLVPNGVEANSTATLRPQGGAIVAGFIIQNTMAGPVDKDNGVVIGAPDVQLIANTIQHSEDTGVRYLAGAMGGHLVGNVITDSAKGVFFKEGGLLVRVQSNVMKKNIVGVIVWTDDVDLGGGLTGSLGKNTIAFNTQADLLIMGPVHVMAQDNYWNNKPPTVHTANNPPAGIDIWNLSGAGTYDASGAEIVKILIEALPNLPFVPLGP